MNSLRVLLIEDSPGDARLIKDMLSLSRTDDFTLNWCETLDAGAQALVERSFDVMLLDLGLPGTWGIETMRQLLARPVKVPALVVMSGLSDEAVALEAIQSGAQDYLVKGEVTAELLSRAIRYAIGRRQAEDLVRAHTAELVIARDRAEVANRAKSAFLAAMSHDLRTPLNGVLGFAQLLQRDKNLTQRQQAGVNAIRQSGEHLLTLINDILDLAKIEAGKFELCPTVFDLARYLDGLVELMGVRARQKPALQLGADLSSGLPATLRADEKRLRQVLLNLLDNAVKFTERGAVTLRVAPCGPSGPGGAGGAQALRFEVQDTGSGMDSAQLSRLFQPFEQVGGLEDRNRGTGLGLAISRQFVRLMGSEIHVRSAKGEGTRFWFDLPLDAAVGETPATESARGCVVGYAGPRRKIMVVDDVATNRALLLDMLGSLGFELCEAGDGAEALAQLESGTPDLILLDILMPHVGGLETLDRLRRTRSQVFVIAISASASIEDKERSLSAGANAFLTKPINLQALMDQMGTLLNLAWIQEAGAAPSA
jgi:signal transduction histidine kinase